MEKEFVPYEQALALKELGFNESCFKQYYNDNNGTELTNGCLSNPKNSDIKSYYKYRNKHCSAPTFSQAFRWFREKYGIFSSVWCFETEQKFFIEFGFGIHKFEVNNKEEAELECLKKLIEIVKGK